MRKKVKKDECKQSRCKFPFTFTNSVITDEERKPGEREFVNFSGKARFPFATIKKSVALVNKFIFLQLD